MFDKIKSARAPWGLLGLLLFVSLAVAGITHHDIVSVSAVADTNDVTRLTVGTTNTFTGDVSMSTATFRVRYSAAPRSSLTPSGIGEIVWNGTNSELCVSTGSVLSSWVRVSTPTLACQS